ncbi:uncharacterized protein LOC129942617 [Eupeodes corollae]|uniref:uncharacterized protein LOC129942617 n=1 Tax=Eupeodes corollae TaxID=290404 RepID=UPI00249372E6|nr:uncharacterized protein LOC129942617 [Eupeodes corollae]
MYICFKCLKHYPSSDDLIRHLKYDHLIKNGNLQCKQNECHQKFSSYRNLRRHLENLHKNSKIIVDQSISRTHATINTSRNFEISVSQVVEPFEVEVSKKYFIGEIINDLRIKALTLSLKLYARTFMPQKEVLEIQKMISSFLSTITNSIELITLGKIPEEITKEFDTLLSFCSDPYQEVKTEHKMFKVLSELKIFEAPKSFVIENKISEKVVKGIPTFDVKSINVYMMSLRFQFKSLFEIPGILRLTIENQEKHLNQDHIKNFINGEVFKEKKKMFQTNFIIPYTLYFDDFQINNPLGTHTSSICACYYTFPTLPQYLQSQLEFLFHAAFISSSYLKKCGNEVTFHHLIEELQHLENGIELETDNGKLVVHFVLWLIVGDNLGLNSLFGFVQSFTAKRYCRGCTRTRSEMKADNKEILLSLRTKENYENDLLQDNFLETGIKSNCIFNNLFSFHVSQNFYFDLMHDVLEGVIVYDVCNILMGLIEHKNISLQILNNRKQLFQYGETEIGNLSSPIDMKRLKSFNLKMTASEVLCFLHFLPLMVGDLIDPKNSYWILLAKLVKMFDLLFKTQFSENDLITLRKLITEHHTHYVKLFGPTLKPKHHFLVHYPTAIKKCGPLKYVWVMRFEAKHKEGKAYLSNITSRLNAPHSLAIKASLQFSYFLTKNKLGIKPPFDESIFKSNVLLSKEYFTELVSFGINLDKVRFAGCVTYEGILYKNNNYLAVADSSFKLYKIISLLFENNNLLTLCSEIKIKMFNEHFQAYEVGEKIGTLLLKNINSFTSPPLHLYQINNGKTFTRNKYL